MKFVSWNVNGIRACVSKGFLEYLAVENPDVVGLQEVKAKEDQNPVPLELAAMGYRVFWHAAERPGYSGTAVLTKVPPISVSYGMGGIIHDDDEGRVTTVEFEDFHFVTVYTPNSKRELERLEYRQLWDSFFFDHLKTLEETKPVIVCGDLNVAHKEIDLTNPRANRGNAGFTDEERSGFQKFVDGGFVDTFRHFYPDLPEQYTWWSNFARSRERNIGWRIDYFLVSPILRDRLENAFIRQEVMGSDHCPVGLTVR
jgi:exodeoxyribonuclease-3